MAEMMVLLGGIPRSGTTALARAVELHPEIFCWSWESAFLPFMDELTGGLPMRAENRALVEDVISRHLVSAIIDQREWHRERGSIAPPVHITALEVRWLAREATHILGRQLGRKQTLEQCASLLEGFFRQYSSRRLIAEKTPSNALLIEQAPNLAQRWLVTHREPFSVLASMLQRSKSDPWAHVMSGQIEQRIGLYQRHADGILCAKSHPEEMMIVPFDELMSNPVGSLANVCMLLQVEPTLRYFEEVKGILGGPVSTSAWKQFTPLDRWKVLCLCGSSMQSLGYSEHYYEASFDQMTQGVPTTLQSRIEPLYGIFEPAERQRLSWVQRRASVAVYAPHGCDKLVLKVYNNITTVIDVTRSIPGCAGDLRVAAKSGSGTGTPIVLSELPLAEDFHEDWIIDLRAAQPVGSCGSWQLFRIDFESSFAYAPCCVLPDASDERMLSFAVSEWRLES